MASPVTTFPVRQSLSNKRSASGISSPLPRDEACPSDCSNRTPKAERTCSARPSASLLPHKVLPSIAIWCGSISALEPPVGKAVTVLKTAAIASGSSMRSVSVKVAWQGDARSGRKPRRVSCRRVRLRPSRNAAAIPCRPLSIDKSISPRSASSGCCRPFLPRGSGTLRSTFLTKTITTTSI